MEVVGAEMAVGPVMAAALAPAVLVMVLEGPVTGPAIAARRLNQLLLRLMRLPLTLRLLQTLRPPTPAP